MTKPLVVIDDDVTLVEEFGRYLMIHARIPILGPPSLLLDLADIRDKTQSATAVILDLNIGGSLTYGRSILRKLCRSWHEWGIPVIVWSKYLSDTTLFEPGRIVRFENLAITEVSDFALLPDSAIINDLRRTCSNTRSFVTKAVPDPVALLFQVLRRSGVIAPELLNTPSGLEE